MKISKIFFLAFQKNKGKSRPVALVDLAHFELYSSVINVPQSYLAHIYLMSPIPQKQTERLQVRDGQS